MANNHCQDATESMAAARVGPAADETATINEFIPIPFMQLPDERVQRHQKFAIGMIHMNE